MDCSSALMRWLTADGVTCSTFAAASKVPSSTTASRVRTCSNGRSVMAIPLTLHLQPHSCYVRNFSWTDGGPILSVTAMTSSFVPAAAAGFGTGLSLIVAIGAQNAFVLRQGLRRQAVLAVVVICALSDAALIALGVAGLGAVVTAWPAALTVVGLVERLLPPLLRRAGRRPRAAPRRRAGPVHPGHHHGFRPGGGPHLPRPDLAQPARLPGHRADAGLDRRRPGPAALGLRGRGDAGQPGVVRRARLRRPPAQRGTGPPGRLARPRLPGGRHDARHGGDAAAAYGLTCGTRAAA